MTEGAGAQVIYLSEDSHADVLTTGFVDQRVQLLRWKWAAERRHGGAPLSPLVHPVKRVCVFGTYTVMTLSLGSGGRPTVSCL